MPTTTVVKPSAMAVRVNRVRDLAYVPLSMVLWAALFQVWEFAAARMFGDRAVASVAAAAVFPIAALPIYTRLAVGFGPTIIQILSLAAVVQAVPGMMPFAGLQTLVAGLVGASRVAQPTGRGSIVRAGLWSGAASAAVFGIIAIWTWPGPGVLAGVAASLVGGALSGAIVLAMSPGIERLLGHVTSLTLLEALSYDHPLMRELMTRAPGTFLHSTNLGVLCDVAARAVGADALIARVGALYHDVGKTVTPEEFAENQRGDANTVVSTRERARVLIAHVTNGVALVLAHGLGDRIADFVREHHGTSEMRSLVDRGGHDADPPAAPLRYPGPRPRSRETGILMIADQIEATARSRTPQTLEESLALARMTVDRLVAEEQLVHSGLADDELDEIEFTLAKVLHAIHHRRVGYPPALEPTPARLRAVKR